MNIEQNVFCYFDELTLDELYLKQSEVLSEIEFLKTLKDKRQKEQSLEFEYSRLRYINKIIRQREENNLNKTYM